MANAMLKEENTLSGMDLKNCGRNIQYLLDSVNPNMNYTKYVKGTSFPGLDISISTLKNAKSGRRISNKTLKQFINAFSSLLKENNKDLYIEKRDMLLSPKAFKAKFPPACFDKILHNGSYLSLESLSMFTNKLYRCYYMISYSPNMAYMAYFKLFKRGDELEACMLRGIQNFELVKNFRNNFDDPEKLKLCCNEFNSKNNTDKQTESVHLYCAKNEDIKTTADCITINFTSYEDTPCHSTMYWNISLANRIKPNSYIGGSSLIVDTNDGVRGKDICAFKMGIETIENTTNQKFVDIGPLTNTSPLLIDELALQARNGSLIIDNSDDSRWFRFLQEREHRQYHEPMYTLADMQKLVHSMTVLSRKYEDSMTKIEEYIKQHGKEKQ